MFSRWRDRVGRTLGLRLALWYAGVFAVSAGVLIALTYNLLAASLERRDHEIVAATLREYAGAYVNGGLDGLARAIERGQAAGRHERLFVRVVSPAGEAVFASVPEEWTDFDVSRLFLTDDDGEAAWGSAPSEDSDSVLEVASLLLPDATRMQVGKSTESRDEILDRFSSLLGAVTGLVLVVGLAGGVILTRSTLRPVHRLAATVRSIIVTGRTDVRVDSDASGDPLDEVSTLVNRMLDRITRLVDGMHESLDNVAHDLKTPLARLRGRAEEALATGDADLREEALGACIAETDRISATLDALMDVAEARTGTLRLHMVPVHMAHLVDDVMELYADAADAKGVTVTADVRADLAVPGDIVRLRQALANLVDNAIKYTPGGGTVTIASARDGQDVIVTVRDTGEGIDPGDLPRIWERLYRGDRSRSSKGLGLGLSLVKAFVEAHGGRVSVHSERGKGAVFTLHLPIGGPATGTANLSSM